MAKSFNFSNNTKPIDEEIDAFCETVYPTNRSLGEGQIKTLTRESIEAQVKAYKKNKNTRMNPPYVTYTDAELYYLPTVVYMGDNLGDEDYSDADISLIIDYVNEMLAGTYISAGETNAYDGVFSGVAAVRAIDDPNHGLDSGIRLRLAPKLPKSMFNPLFQSLKCFVSDDDARTKSVNSGFWKYLSSPSSIVNLITNEPYPGDLYIDGKTYQDLYESSPSININKCSVANLNEGTSRDDYFTCGPYGAILRFDSSPLYYDRDVNAVINLNNVDAGRLFSDGSKYDVFKYNNTAYSHPDHDKPWPSRGFVINAIDDDNINTSGTHTINYQVPAINIFMTGLRSSSQAQFPSSPLIENQILNSGKSGWHKLTTPGATGAGGHVNSLTFEDTVSGNHWIMGMRRVANTMFHELGHTLGFSHEFQGGSTAPESSKIEFMPLINTKKSWFTNADSFVPPFTYTEVASPDPDDIGVVKDYKDISTEEKGYLEMMLSNVPRDITANYTRKYNFNNGVSSGVNAFFTNNYPTSIQSPTIEHTASQVQDASSLKYVSVLTAYLDMFLTLDSLWGDSYMLFDDSGNNVSEANGGKPEFIVNPTDEVVDGLLQSVRTGIYDTLDSAEDLIYENILSVRDVTDVENYTADDIENCYYSSLGGWVMAKLGNGRVSVLKANISGPEDSVLLSAAVAASTSDFGGSGWQIMHSDDYLAIKDIIAQTNLPQTPEDSVYRFSRFINGTQVSFPIIINQLYWMSGGCNTTGTTGQYDNTYSPNGTNCIWLTPAANSAGGYLSKWCSATNPFTPGTLSSNQLPNLAVTGVTLDILPLFTKEVLLLTQAEVDASGVGTNASAGIEVIPPNRKGPMITSRVPFCVPVIDEDTGLYVPSDVFDPAWFANINWRDPKNRAYPENWPVSKLYDEFDANGDSLCPCLYAEQTVRLNGVVETYTPIDAYRTGFIGGVSRTLISETGVSNPTFNAMQLSAYYLSLDPPLSAAAEILVQIANIPTLSEKVYYKHGALVFKHTYGGIQTNQMYVDSTDNVQIDSSHDTWPLNLRHRKYTTAGNTTGLFNTYNMSEGNWFSMGTDTGGSYGSPAVSPMGYPHAQGHFFKNFPIGYKPYPGGYGSSDPIHYIMAPMGACYYGMSLYGNPYAKFRLDWTAISEEHTTSQTLIIGDNFIDYWHGMFFQMYGSGNSPDDLTTRNYSLFNGGSIMNADRHKFIFGSTNPASAYYNPYRLNIFKASDIPGLDKGDDGAGNPTPPPYSSTALKGMVPLAMQSQFGVLNGTTYVDANGNSQTLLGKSSPIFGDMGSGQLNNAMAYGHGGANVGFIEGDDAVCFLPITSGRRSGGATTNYDWAPLAENINKTAGSFFDPKYGCTGTFMSTSYFTPHQIFSARAFIENSIGNLSQIKQFGVEINVREEYSSSNTLQDHIEYCQNKMTTSVDYIAAYLIWLEDNLGFNVLYDPFNTNSCDDGHCEEATVLKGCMNYDGLGTVCNELNDYILEAFLPGDSEVTGPLISCPTINMSGCYVEKDNTQCNLEVTTTNASCDIDGVPTAAVYTCEGPGLSASVVWGNFIPQGVRSNVMLYAASGDTVDADSYFTRRGRIFASTEEENIIVYYNNPNTTNKTNSMKSAKNFEKIAENLRKIVSFAKQ